MQTKVFTLKCQHMVTAAIDNSFLKISPPNAIVNIFEFIKSDSSLSKSILADACDVFFVSRAHIPKHMKNCYTYTVTATFFTQDTSHQVGYTHTRKFY